MPLSHTPYCQLWKSVLIASLTLYPLALSQLHAATYHVDAINGSDASGDGSAAAPYASLSPVYLQLSSGDQVFLYDGNYGALEYHNQSADIFNDWVTIQAAEGHRPELDHISFHSSNPGPDRTGSFNAYLRVIGCDIVGTSRDQAVSITSARYVEIDQCRLEVHGPWTGSENNIEKTAFYVRYGSHITLSNSEITRTGTGVSAQGRNIQILYNHIHDITHDGIRATGLEDSLIEGNHIHGLDDGVDDNQASWSKHCDAIHIFIAGGGSADSLIPNVNLIVRGNIIHDIEAQSVQFNNYFRFPEVHNANITFENNIFGPVNSVFVFNDAEPVDGLTIRNNSFLYIPGGTSYVSPNNETHRTLISDNHGLRVTDQTTDLQVYNNILPYGAMPTDTADVFANNVIFNAPSENIYVGDQSNIATPEEQFVNPLAFDGALRNTSWAIDRASTTLPIHPTDIHGVTRNTPAEAGASEFFVTEIQPIVGIARWDFDNNSLDSSGNNLNSSLQGNASYTTDRISGTHALELDGSGDFAVIPNHTSLQITGDLTLAAHIKPTSTGMHQNILAKSFNDGYRLRVTNNGKLQLILGIPDSGPGQVVGATSLSSVTYGAWQHVACTVSFNGSSAEVRFYINGVHDSTIPLSLSGIEAGNGDLYIGSGNAAIESFTGLIDNAMIFDYSLSSQDIQTIYTNHSLPTDPVDGNTPPTIEPMSSLIVNVGASLQLRVSAEDRDGELMTMSAGILPEFIQFTDHHNGRADFEMTPQLADIGDYRILLSVSDGEETSYAQIPVRVQAPRAVGYWTFNGDMLDHSGWGHPTQASGGASLSTDAPVGSHALALNGDDQHLVIDDAPVLRITGDMTLAAYIKTTTSGQSQNIIAKSFNDGYRLRLSGANQPQLILGAGASVIGISSESTIPVGQWRHIAVTITFEGSVGTARFYIDGQLSDTESFNASGIEAGNGALVIGAASPTNTESFEGLIDQVRIENRALSAAEIENIIPHNAYSLIEDTDNDGVANIYDYAFNGDPAAGRHVAFRQFSEQILPSENGPTLSMTFPVRADGIYLGDGVSPEILVDGITYRIHGDTDLSPPYDLPVMEVSPAITNGLPSLVPEYEYRTFRLAPLSGEITRGFMTVEVLEQ
ncbi:LamG-like jellyroll fold domain-containing protein [Cerasicoccus fimbriatus]|uniref:LamG-like jellyroll fold domain-containing protein n=1 Tax=Cerasicoccus fimbriatus TaxID=3014554 RepID=UPI0022B55132|nr:LamG-like jellyroll fold domain-containing protein [Cerasicoccus sp. TK19100]